MLHYVTCPTCQNKLAIPEGQVGKRHTCPQCQALFVAGKSEPAIPPSAPPPEPSMLAGAGAPPSPAPAGLNKTMLGETEPPIRYSCPRCKKPLEDPASEAGNKKPCPYCGQRIQVPVPAPGANKTMLGQETPTATAAPPQIPYAQPGTAAGQHRCLECGRDVSGWDKLFTCQDCGSLFCSSLCIREHRYHAHERRRPPPPREPFPEPPPPDNTGLIIGLTVGGVFLVVLVIVLISMSRWW
jgi:DNA-directed RNA polymerase subunit RPC12/RpoP